MRRITIKYLTSFIAILIKVTFTSNMARGYLIDFGESDHSPLLKAMAGMVLAKIGDNRAGVK